MKLALAVVTVAAALVAPVAHAEGAPPAEGYTGLVLTGAYEFGGDTIVSAPGSSKELKAGEGIDVGIGAYHRFAGSPVSLRGTVGLKFAGAEINNVKYALTRVPLEFIASYHFANEARVGGGVVVHTAVKLSSDGPFPDQDLKNAAGLELEAGYKMLLFTLTGLDYKDDFGNKAKAGSVGFRLLFEFGAPSLQ